MPYDIDMAKTEDTTTEETFELDLSVLDDTEIVAFEALLVEKYKEIRESEEFDAATDKEELANIKDTLVEVRAEMDQRAADAEEAALVADTKGASFAATIAKATAKVEFEPEEEDVAEEAAPAEVEAAVEEPVVAKSDVVISPKGLSGDKPVVTASAQKPLAKIAADVRGFKAGQEVASWDAVAQAFINRHPDTRSSDLTSGGRFLVASIDAEFPEDRILGDDPVFNTRTVNAVVSEEAIVASGGLCAPLTPWYNLQTYGDVCRPLRDSFPSFKADRGGIRFVAPPKLSDLSGSTRRTTAAQDAAGYTNQDPAGSTAPKPCLHVICGAESTCIVQAVSSCLTFGNFGARTYPEQVEAWLKLGRVEFARYQETELLTALNAGSIQLTAAQEYGANYSIITQVGYAIDSFKARFRVCGNVMLNFVAPFWLKSILKNDIAAQGPGDGLARYSVSDAIVTDWFAARGVRVTWTQETSGAAPFAAPVPGAMGAYPATVKWFLFPEGEWVYLDSGTLDLGLVRDSTLNSQNDYQIWMEEFSGLCQVGGVESIAVTSTVCANGSTAPAAAALICDAPA